MTTRVLPPDEWPRLIVTDAWEAWPHLDPARNTVVVTEHEGAIVGCVILMQAVHAEFLWIAPEHRGKTSVFRRLRDGMLSTARALGTPTVWMAAMSTQMHGIVCGLGAERVPGAHFLLNLKETTPCRQQ